MSEHETVTNNADHEDLSRPDLDDDSLVCECSPDLNPGCKLGSHAEGHLVPAEWRVGIDDDPDSFMYLCSPCLGSVLSGGLRGLVLERFALPDPEAVIPIEVDAEVWSLLSERQLRLTREQRRLVSLNDTVKDLLSEEAASGE